MSILSVGLAAVLAPHAAAQTCGVTQQAKIVSTEAGPGHVEGTSVAGATRLMVGAPRADGGLPGNGAVYVHSFNGAAWSQIQKIDSSDPGVLQFGASVAADGDRIAIGAPASNADAGAAFVFVDVAGVLLPDGVLLPPVDTWSLGGRFGETVAVSSDTDRIVVGAPCSGQALTGNTCPGAVYVFHRDLLGVWVLETRILNLGSGTYMGAAVDLLAATLTIGMPNDLTLNQPGRVLIYDRVGSTWTYTTEVFDAASVQFEGFGSALSLAPDRLAVGAPHAIGGGAAVLFSRDQLGAWSKEAQIVSNDLATDDLLGTSVMIEGDKLCVGAPGDDDTGANAGSAYLFERGSNGWYQFTKFRGVDTGAGDQFGWSLDLDGGRIFAGAPRDGGFGHLSGASYVFAESAPTLYCTAKVNSQGCTPTIGFDGVPSLSAGVFQLRATQVLNNKTGLLFYGANGATAIGFQGGFLCVKAPIVRMPAQASGGSAAGTDCTGTLVVDFNAWAQSGVDPTLIAGAKVDAQYWSRDPASASTTSLTDAVEFTICP